MTDSTLPAASFSTAATWNGFRTHVVSALTCKRYAVGTIVTEATTGGVAVVLSLLHAAKIAVAATTPTSTRFMHCSLQLLCRAPVVPPAATHRPGGTRWSTGNSRCRAIAGSSAAGSRAWKLASLHTPAARPDTPYA